MASNEENECNLWEQYVYVFKSTFDSSHCLRAEMPLPRAKRMALWENFSEQCPTCKLRFVKYEDIKAHFKRHLIGKKNDDDSFFCECCGNVYSTLEDLLQHESTDHIKKTLVGIENHVQILDENHHYFKLKDDEVSSKTEMTDHLQMKLANPNNDQNVMRLDTDPRTANQPIPSVVPLNHQQLLVSNLPTNHSSQPMFLVNNPNLSGNFGGSGMVQLVDTSINRNGLNNSSCQPLNTWSGTVTQQNSQSVRVSNQNQVIPITSVPQNMIPFANNVHLNYNPIPNSSLNNCQTVQLLDPNQNIPNNSASQHFVPWSVPVNTTTQQMSMNNMQAVEHLNQTQNISNISTTPNNANLLSNASMTANTSQFLKVNSSTPLKFVNFKSNISNNSVSQTFISQNNAHLNRSTTQQFCFDNTQTVESANYIQNISNNFESPKNNSNMRLVNPIVTPSRLDINKQTMQVENQTPIISSSINSQSKPSMPIGKLTGDGMNYVSLQGRSSVDFENTKENIQANSSNFQTHTNLSNQEEMANKSAASNPNLNKPIQQQFGLDNTQTVESTNNSQKTLSVNLNDNQSASTTTIMDPNKIISLVLYSCFICNTAMLELEDLQKHYELEHSNENNNQTQDQPEQISNNSCNLDLQQHFATQSQENIDDSQHEPQPVEFENDHQYLPQSPEMHSSNSNVNNNEKQIAVLTISSDSDSEQRHRSSDMDQYSPTCSSIEEAELQENSEDADIDFTERIVQKKPGKRGPKKKSEAEDPRTCPDCGKRFDFPSVMQRHRVVHSKSKVFTCSHCKTGFKQKIDLKRHMLTNHQNISDWPYSCQECGGRFPSTVTLRRHNMVYHTDPSTWPYHCRYCKKPFVVRGELNRHMRKHTNERPFVCDVCHMRFKQTVHLAKHIRSMKHEQLTDKNLPDPDTEEFDDNDMEIEDDNEQFDAENQQIEIDDQL